MTHAIGTGTRMFGDCDATQGALSMDREVCCWEELLDLHKEIRNSITFTLSIGFTFDKRAV